MQKSKYKIHIVGAGVSGLIAAQILEKHGYHPVIFEASDRAGGRVKTDKVHGHLLDHGFQVLLTAYPLAQKYLDFKTLHLKYFKPGAVLFEAGKHRLLGDPLRDLSFLIPTLFSKAGNFRDKLKIFQLNRELRKKSQEGIFESTEQSTMDFLKAYGFSEKIIRNFFQPFFGGIFLEPDLETSSRMFRFVYKMFGEGRAAIPKTGIEAIPQQLQGKLKHTKFRFSTPVKKVEEGKITLKDGAEIRSHLTIVATEASALVPNLRNQDMEWQSCDTLYFETDKKQIKGSLIGLVTDPGALINNIVYSTKEDQKPDLLSVTVVNKHELSEEVLVERVVEELKEHCGIQTLRFLKRYSISRALPKMQNLKYSLPPSETRLNSTVFLAGDVLLNGSLNAAMLSGEQAARGVVALLEESQDLDHLISEYL